MGALENVGHVVSRGTVVNVLNENGIVPAPERKKRTRWKDFLAAHWEILAATDFFTVEVWTPRGLITYYVLFVIELSTRRVEIAGITPSPNSRFMAQVARELTGVGGFLEGKGMLLHDPDSKFTDEFRATLRDSGVKCLRLPRRSPNLNAYAERFVLSIKSESLDRLIFFGEDSLRRAVSNYIDHYHTERNHQGLDNRLLSGEESKQRGRICCRTRLGGMLKYYYRAA